MNKTYSSINWENYPSGNTPINDENLNKMDTSINEIDDRVLQLDEKKATKEEVAPLIRDVQFNESTGIFTITRKNGSLFIIDTKLEKIAINWTYDVNTQQIILTLDDGTKQYIDLSALITQYEFLDTDTINFQVQTDGTVKAIVKDGSITEDKLQPNYLAQIKVESAKAQISEANAANSAKKAESWAHGNTGIRAEESTNNSKYWSEQSKEYADSWKGSLLPQRTILFSQIPISGNIAGHMYNINEAFVTDSRFKDGAGYSYPAGTNVYWTQDSKWDCLSGTLTRTLTQVEYNNLTHAEKMNGTIYYITDGDNSLPSASETEFGLMSPEDKKKLDDIETGAQVNVQSDWNITDSSSAAYIKNKPSIPLAVAVKGSSESTYRTGNVNLTAENIGALPITGGTIHRTEEYMNINEWGIEGNSNQSLTNFDLVEANDIKGYALYYNNEDTDTRYANKIHKHNKADFSDLEDLKIGSDGKATISYAEYAWDSNKLNGKAYDNFVTSGIYHTNIDLNNPSFNKAYITVSNSAEIVPKTNDSTSGYWHIMFFPYIGMGGGSGTQIAMPFSGNKLYMRSANGGKWSDWVSIADGGNADKVDGKHASDFVNKSGDTMTGDLVISNTRPNTSNPTLPASGSLVLPDLMNLCDYRSFLGTYSKDGNSDWNYLINIRHRNGFGDGNLYGMYIKAPFSGNNKNLSWGFQHIEEWSKERTLLDSVNYKNYCTPANIGALPFRELTQAQYNSLSNTEKMNGTLYFITDAN